MKQARIVTLSFLIGLFIIFFLYNYFSGLNFRNLEPPTYTLTGNTIYEKPLTLEELKEGIALSAGWNVFIWTEEIYEPVPASEGLKSLADYYYYAYDYADKKFYFNPYQKLADYKDKRYYSNRTFANLEPGKKYAVYMLKSKVELQYEISEEKPEEETAELKENSGLLNNFWFWFAVVIVILLVTGNKEYQKKILLGLKQLAKKVKFIKL